MDQNPLISIIIPAFNRVNIIEKTLQSIECQSYKSWECIVVDDGSEDDISQVITGYTKKDKRFRFFINNRKKGAQGARNTGYLASAGKWVIFFDSDNQMLPDFLDQMVKKILNTKIDVCTCYSHVVNDNEEITGTFAWITRGNILEGLLESKTYVDFNSAIISTNLVDQIGLLDEDCPSFQEWDSFIRIAKLANFETVHQLLIKYYRREGGTTFSERKSQIRGMVYIYQKHRNMWLEINKEDYYQKLRSLAGLLLEEDKLFRKEITDQFNELKKEIKKLIIIQTLRKYWNYIK